MRNVPPAEWFLSQDIGKERAAAIMGDLEELATTRGRLWFWAEYIRTLMSLGWRTGGSAFILAMVCMRLFYRIVLPLLMNHRITHLRDDGLFSVLSTHARIILFNYLINAARLLIFALPFVVVRFGLRNRLTQLTCALLLIAVPVYTLRPWLMDLSGVLMVVAIVAALLFPLWRKPMVVLAGTCVTAIATVVACVSILVGVFRQNIITVSGSKSAISEAIGFAAAAIVCIRLHHWLMERRSSPGITPIAGDADA